MLNRLSASSKRDEGFTLIELLVVVIIIGVLAAIALPVFIDQSKVAVDASVQSDVRNSVTNITNAQAQQAPTAKAALSNSKTRVVLTSRTAISTATRAGSSPVAELSGIPALGTAYTVCGYNEDGKKFTGPQAQASPSTLLPVSSRPLQPASLRLLLVAPLPTRILTERARLLPEARAELSLPIPSRTIR